MLKTNFTFKGSVTDVYVNKWTPQDKNIKGVVQIIHGSLEHSDRYDRFARYLVKEGYVVYANDHLSHGNSILNDMYYYSNNDNGIELAIKDIETLNKIIVEENKNKKVFILGHSMGSFMLRKLLIDYNILCHGAIISGTGGGNNQLMNLFIKMCNMNIKLNGRRNRNKFLHGLIYGKLKYDYFKQGKPYEFITNDEKERQKYIDDKMCGNVATTEYLLELIKLVKWCKRKESFKSSKKVPLFIISGEEDSIGGRNCKEVQKAYKNYVKSGWYDTEIKIYENCKHELLNELNRDIVSKDILNFINRCICE